MTLAGVSDRIRSRYAGDDESFYAADRQVGVLFGAMSLTATQVSAGTLIGTVGIHYTVGVGFGLIWLGIWAGWLCSMLFVAPPLRAAGGYTVSNYLATRFGTGNGHVRALAAVFVAAIYLVYTTAQYVAGGILLQAIFGLEQFVGMSLLMVFALSYTVVGGMRFSVYSDVIQVAVLVGGVAVAATVGVLDVGGLGALASEASRIDPKLLSLSGAPALTLGLAMSFGFGITVAPFELSRVYAMRDPATVRRAIPLSVLIQAVIAVCIATLGLLARVRFPELANPDAAVTALALDLFGPVVGSLLLLAVVAAILSTVDSVLLVTSAAVSSDLYAKALPALGLLEAAPDRTRLVRVGQAATVLAAVAPLVLALFSGWLGGLVQLIVALYTSLLAGALFVPVVGGLHWSGATKAGALGGMVGGFCAVALWQFLRTASVLPVGQAVDPVVPGLLCSLVAFVFLSRVPG
jgi:SSS family transporter